MVHGVATAAVNQGLGTILSAMIARDGSASQSYISGPAFTDDREAARNLADAAHYLSMLHGHHPGVIELASSKTAIPVARSWLEQAEQGFARERLFLSHLTVAAGPLPSTPGHDKSEAAVLSQRHAIETLASSERVGCALGAAIALVLDWQAIRPILLSAAEKLDVEAPLLALPDSTETVQLADSIDDEAPAIQRAVNFGADQILAQHRGLWNLLEAREAARDMW